MTLVELIIAVAFTAVVITAACTVLYLGANSFKSGTSNAVNQQNAALAESYMQRYASTAYTISSTVDTTVEGIVFTLSDSTLRIQKQTVSDSGTTLEPVVSLDGISQIGLKLESGVLKYTIVAADKTYSLEGGIVLNNNPSGSVPDSLGQSGAVLFFGTKQAVSG